MRKLIITSIVVLFMLGFSFEDKINNLIYSYPKDNIEPLDTDYLKSLTSNDNEVFLSNYTELINQRIEEIFPGIIFWGDSITDGHFLYPTYPVWLRQIISEKLLSQFDINKMTTLDYSIDYLDKAYNLKPINIVNMGVGAENSATIIGRNGAVPMVVKDDFVLPADQTPVKITLESQIGEKVWPLRFTDLSNGGVNDITINGIKGKLICHENNYWDDYYYYTFIRNEIGEETLVEKGSVVKTNVSDKYLDYALVVFVGTNDGDNIDSDIFVYKHQKLADHQQNDKYIYVGMAKGTYEEFGYIDDAMSEEFGEKYIRLREYMATNALKDNGLPITGSDYAFMAKGMTPSSIRTDELHFTTTGLRVIANTIYQRMDKLGYFDQIKDLLLIEK